MTFAPPPDQEERDAIVNERTRNVVVSAGAGTGKTTTILDRAVALLAPADDSLESISIRRMAAITFTRRAAGELRFRLRERLLRELERASRAGEARTARLREALGSLDAAFVGTIHGFADRLLRQRPAEADLSPAYVLVEDEADLVHEAVDRLRHAAEHGAVGESLGIYGTKIPKDLIAEGAATLRAAVRAGLTFSTEELGFGAPRSIEEMFRQMIAARDIEVEFGPASAFDLDGVRDAARQFRERVGKLTGTSSGARYLRRLSHSLERLERISDPADAVHLITDALRRPAPAKRDFGTDSLAAGVFGMVAPRSSGAWVREKLSEPHGWLANGLVRLAPLVAAMYERVKAEREVVDYLDLLLKLRNLLRDNPAARAHYQAAFDHIFVDEFQDTDPLQCEIVFYLGANGPDGEQSCSWRELDLVPGKLTIVGDPQQSIYRFRRADISIYAQAVERLLECGALFCRLDTNFRSNAGLIAFFNRQLGQVLGRDSARSFDPVSGRAFFEDLRPATAQESFEAAVHVLPYIDADQQGLLAGEGRRIEASMWARYIAWLLEHEYPVRDPDTGEIRPVRPGDIAVLACVTTNVPLLLRELDRLNLEYCARGGTLFLGHPIIRTFLAALRALADRDDGVAEAALLQPPFFAIDPADLVASTVSKDAASDIRRARVEQARETIASLRRRRHAQSPGATARDLVERTGLGRSATIGRNAAQTISALYELCAEVDRRARLAGVDFDGISEMLRGWAVRPAYLDTAEPIGRDAVNIMTIHSAKGLEFPITILWDGFQVFGEWMAPVWHSERDGKAWALGLGPLAVEYPEGNRLLRREQQFGEAEGRRKYYVAATRARDVLAIPMPTTKGKLDYAAKSLLEGVDEELITTFAQYREPNPPQWAVRRLAPLGAPVPDDRFDTEEHQRQVQYAEALAVAARPYAVPTAVTTAVREAAARAVDEVEVERLEKVQGGRNGPQFGAAVHRTLQLLLQHESADFESILEVAVKGADWTGEIAAVRADVERGLATLRELGIERGDRAVAVEYPLSLATDDGRLMNGILDVLAIEARWVTVLDFKTDPPPPGKLEWSYRGYVEQLHQYAEMIDAAGIVGTRSLRLGLLFTADGSLHWID